LSRRQSELRLAYQTIPARRSRRSRPTLSASPLLQGASGRARLRLPPGVHLAPTTAHAATHRCAAFEPCHRHCSVKCFSSNLEFILNTWWWYFMRKCLIYPARRWCSVYPAAVSITHRHPCAGCDALESCASSSHVAHDPCCS